MRLVSSGREAHVVEHVAARPVHPLHVVQGDEGTPLVGCHPRVFPQRGEVVSILLGRRDVSDVAFNGRREAQLQEAVHLPGGRHSVLGDGLVADGLDAVRVRQGQLADLLRVGADHGAELLGGVLDGGLLVGLEDGHLGGEGPARVAHEVEDFQVG